jgi:hypothetical protein
LGKLSFDDSLPHTFGFPLWNVQPHLSAVRAGGLLILKTDKAADERAAPKIIGQQQVTINSGQ